MKCSNHHEADAVAVCNLCCRGLCKDCVTFVRDSAACLNRCEAIVEVEKSVRIRNFNINKAYISKDYPDEELLRFQFFVTNYITWLVLLAGLWCFLLYKFYKSSAGQGGLLIFLLCVLAVIIFGLITGLVRWRKLLAARRAVLKDWHSL